LKQSLAGKLSFAFTEGTVKGFNLGRKLREAVAKLKGQTLPEDSEPNETDFSLLKGSAVIAQGVLDNQDLSAMSPLFRVTGKGQVDIAQDTLDYKIKPVLVASISGQGGEDLEKLKGVPIPVHLTGPLNAPHWRIDLAEALTETQKAKVQEKFSKELEKRLPKELQGDDPNGVQKQLEGVFKGFFN
jgi:AsmA protein